MPNYKEMYLKMFRASEKAIKLLKAVQNECKDMYIDNPESEFALFAIPTSQDKTGDAKKPDKPNK